MVFSGKRASVLVNRFFGDKEHFQDFEDVRGAVREAVAPLAPKRIGVNDGHFGNGGL